VGFIGGCACLGEKPEQMIAAAKALDKQFVEAMNKRDVDAAMATRWNSPDYVSYPDYTMEIRGWRAAKVGTEKMFADVNLMPPGATAEVTEANYKVAGDVIIGWGKWHLRIGESMVVEGRYTNVVAKRDGKWVYILDHLSVPFTPPPMSPSRP
jgi:ketosteroid isomerase-like protein